MLAAQNNWLAYQNGRASDVSWNHARDQAVAHLGSRAARIYWKYGKFEYHVDFVEQIDAQLAGRDPLQTEGAMRQMLKEIRSLDVNSAIDGSLTTSPAKQVAEVDSSASSRQLAKDTNSRRFDRDASVRRI